MFWEEEKPEVEVSVPDDVVDLVFSIACRSLPVDHAYELSQAIQQYLPWFKEEAQAALHTIHVAASSNGWIRPENPDDVLYPSRRTKMIVRIPKHRIEATKALCGKTLDIAHNSLQVKSASLKPLSDLTTLFSRYIVCDAQDSEMDFLMRVKTQLNEMNIKPKKMLCGTQNSLRTPGALLNARSLMLAELELKESIILQQNGLGPYLAMGCGIFIPHKDIRNLGDDD
ncbi:MAG: type I-MYXAN CRISPR-associated protein Cas6/Cmx6 [Gammaproteobacteria bacterium]|nr:type I-MYXAN CRISPR-associated protein Cas6/Cmx6 [Gammaproteobacteria bacterium]MDH5801780.1 type I-MYXAN CRISPR-associated protein Cas6/Cmx6 [Gammaproteobacteria bacterium]